jgi:ABC-type branched-subunit amino acid transport system permease subunit
LRIAGLPELKGLVLYGATLTFVGFYAYFMVRIAQAPSHKPPQLNTAMVSAAAALAGVLGSAFALAVGTPAPAVNEDLAQKLQSGSITKCTRLRQFLSLEPAAVSGASWPQTFGIWMYACVALAVGAISLLNQAETPETLRALAVAFGGYVVALMTGAYGIATKQ